MNIYGTTPPQQTLIDGPTRLYVIIGDPVAQVKSPRVFNPLFAASGRDAVLVPVHVTAERFEDTMRGLLAVGNLDGIIVTVPFKARVLPLLDRVLPMAEKVGAVNALRRESDGSWVGDIFDGRGLVRGLLQENVRLAGRKVMLLGAGGAGSAVAVAMAEAGVAALNIFDIVGEKAEALCTRVVQHFPACRASSVPMQLADHDMLINATPVGMDPHRGIPTALDGLTSRVTVIDIIMKPEVTELLARARSAGCETFGGRVMLEGQAAEVTLFFGLEARS